jgi:hypothetical protein
MLARILALCLCWLAATVRADTIDVAVTIRDEAGKTIPYVAVWRAIEFDRRHVKDDGHYRPLSIDDLWRVTQRYGELHDIIAEAGDKPLAALMVPAMGDADGIFVDIVDYQEATGRDNRYPRPDPLAVGYTFMKRGYLPGKVAFAIRKDQNRVEAAVTLKRNPDESVESQPYLREFARLRHELSDRRRNLDVTEENRQRLDTLQAQMELAARQALAAGDKPAAARIYSRMRYLPVPQFVDGKVVGIIEDDAGNPQARQAMDKAYELDPEGLYVWMQTYTRRIALLPTPTMEERITASLSEVERLIAAKGEAVWPRCFVDQAAGHVLLGRYEKAYRLYRAAARREPKYMDWDVEIGNLKALMKSNGMAVPAD